MGLTYLDDTSHDKNEISKYDMPMLDARLLYSGVVNR